MDSATSNTAPASAPKAATASTPAAPAAAAAAAAAPVAGPAGSADAPVIVSVPLTELLFEISGTGVAPDKTFYHFGITKTEVVWRWWKLSPRRLDRNTSRPGQLRESHEDFLSDGRLQTDLGNIFGQQVLQYAMSLCQGQYEFMEPPIDS